MNQNEMFTVFISGEVGKVFEETNCSEVSESSKVTVKYSTADLLCK